VTIHLSTADARKLGLAAPKAKRRARPPAVTVKAFPALCVAHGLPEPVSEFLFAPPRKWRFDWAWVKELVALEVEGGVWVKGRHTRGVGFLGDVNKYNEAALLGWTVLRCVPGDVKSGYAVQLVKRAF
jgi:hypothetical protein